MAFGANKAPIETLPVELLSSIFVLATHSSTDPDNTIAFQSDSIHTPVIFSAVNRHWRAVARDTPALWTSISVTVGSILGPVGGDQRQQQQTTVSSFDNRQISEYLCLSRQRPVDVLIDARDQGWDFSEPEIPSSYDRTYYSPPFSTAHMHSVMSILCPHISRWRTCVILTDTWAPMHAALSAMTRALIHHGPAKRLQSLVLMRCNDYISHAPDFQPPSLKYPAFLDFETENIAAIKDYALLPQLRQLSLRGVHVDWSSLADILENSSEGEGSGGVDGSGGEGGAGPISEGEKGGGASILQTLELSSHSHDVRPPLLEFQRLLQPHSSSFSHIRKLIIHGSGPRIPEFSPFPIFQHPDPSSLTPSIFAGKLPESIRHSLSFPRLEHLVIGYRSETYAIDLLEIFDLASFGSLKEFVLEDASHPGEVDDVDSGELLVYLARGERWQEHATRVNTIATWSIGEDGRARRVDEPASPASSSSTEEEQRAREEEEKERHPKPPLANLTTLTLKNVKAHPSSFQQLFVELKSLSSLEIFSTSLNPLLALTPNVQFYLDGLVRPVNTKTREPPIIPCPALKALMLRGFEGCGVSQLDHVVSTISVARAGLPPNNAASLIEKISIRIGFLPPLPLPPSPEPYVEGEDGLFVQHEPVPIQVGGGVEYVGYEPAPTIGEAVGEGDEGGEEYFSDQEYEEAQFLPGGAFNDPVFDAYYA